VGVVTSTAATLRNNYDCRPDRGGCGAVRGDYCVAASGKLTAPHAARWDEYFGRPSSRIHVRLTPRPGRELHREAAFNRAIRKLASRLDECRAILDELERHLEETDDAG
jgi:hypothetical protein